jgi:dihydropteroate synthase
VQLRVRGHVLELDPSRPAVMGILNVGDDSVADPLHLQTVQEQLKRARQLLEEGAAIVDVGAVSGRTDTPPIPEAKEAQLLAQVVEPLAAEGVVVSVDTWRVGVVEAVLAAGAALINDVSGLADPAIARLCAEAGAGLVVMHTKARPKERHFPPYADLIGEVTAFLRDKVELACRSGMAPEGILVDPGLDFAKTPEQSVELLRRLGAVRELGFPLLLAVSRKYFVGMLTGRPPLERLAGTLGAIAGALRHGVEVVRVHDVGAVQDFLAVYAAITTTGEVELKGDPADDRLRWLPPKAVSSRDPG